MKESIRILCLFLICWLPRLLVATDYRISLTDSKQFIEVVKKAVQGIVLVQTSTHEGSGFFIQKDGYIVTNSHLVENANSITVTTYDNQVFTAQIIQLDLKTDIALLKIEGSNFVNLHYGNPDELKIGDFIVSIGCKSIALGIVKEIGIHENFSQEECLKTTAPIYLGNSGGPLLNKNGEVVGINAVTLVDKEGKYLEESLAISSKLAPQLFPKTNNN